MGTRKRAQRLAVAAIAGGVGLLHAANFSPAASIIWTGSNGAVLESTSNWSPTPASGELTAGADLAAFTSIASAFSLSVDTGVWFAGVTIDNTGAAWTIGQPAINSNAHAITLGAAGLTATGSGIVNWTPSSTVLASAQSWTVGSGLTVATDASTKISFSNKLTKSGAGTLLLQGASTGSAGVEVAQGTLATHQSTSVAGNGLITVDSGATFEARSVTVGTNTVVLNTGATLRGTGASGIAASSGISLSSSGGAVSISSGTASTDTFTLASTVQGGDNTNAIVIGGSGTVVLQGGSTSATAFAGLWKITSGTVRVFDLNGLGDRSGSASATNVSNASRIELAGGTLAAAGTNDETVSIALNNNVTVTANSSILIDRQDTTPGAALSGNARKFNSLSIGPSTLSIGLSDRVTGPNDVTATEVSFTDATLTGNATFNVSGAVNKVGLAIIGAVTENGASYGLTKSGGGLLELRNVNTYTGGTTVTGGQLRFFNTGGVTTSSLNTAANTSVVLNTGGPANWVLTNTSLSGNGTILAQGTSNVTLSMKGLTIDPGTNGTVGSLTLQTSASSNKSVSITSNGMTMSMLRIDVTGTGSQAGTDYDQLVLAGATLLLGDLHTTNLVINTGSLSQSSFAGGQLLKIVSSPNLSFASIASAVDTKGFLNVTTSGGWKTKVFYLNDGIAVALPEPASIACVTLIAGAMLQRRRRSRGG